MQTSTFVRTAFNTALAALFCAAPALGQNPQLQEKVAALKQASAENKQRLMQYQWTETQQVAYKGETKSTKQFLCQYVNGQVQKTPIEQPGQAQPQQSGRQHKLKEHVVEKKKEEMQDYMGDVKGVLSMYVPPDPQKMQAALQSGNVSFVPSGGAVNIVFKNYAQPGDQMTVTFNEAAKKVSHVDVNTYTEKPDQVVTLNVQFATLPDGTNYSQQTVLDAKAKNVVVTTTNSNYQKLGQ